jgi:hypothetical protein
MRDADTHPDASRAKAFALAQHIKDRAVGDPGYRGSAFRKLLQRLSLARRPQLRDYAARRDQLANVHILARLSSRDLYPIRAHASAVPKPNPRALTDRVQQRIN